MVCRRVAANGAKLHPPHFCPLGWRRFCDLLVSGRVSFRALGGAGGGRGMGRGRRARRLEQYTGSAPGS